MKAGIIVKTIDESKRVLDRLAKKERRVLVRTGGFGRRAFRQVIRRRKKVKSKPGNPPFAHAPGNSGLKDVRYAVEPGQVTIGHIKYKAESHRTRQGFEMSFISRKPVPQLLNEGGDVTVRAVGPLNTVVTPTRYDARPFRDKAFDPTEKFFKNLLREERL